MQQLVCQAQSPEAGWVDGVRERPPSSQAAPQTAQPSGHRPTRPRPGAGLAGEGCCLLGGSSVGAGPGSRCRPLLLVFLRDPCIPFLFFFLKSFRFSNAGSLSLSGWEEAASNF